MTDGLRYRVLRYIDRRRDSWVAEEEILTIAQKVAQAPPKETRKTLEGLLLDRLIEKKDKPAAYISRVAQRQEEWFNSL